MRIIDKNTDYYDYLQNVYRDDSITFDRTDSFVLTKEIMCNYLYVHNRGFNNCWVSLDDNIFVLMQICNTFWLFRADVTRTSDHDMVTDYNIKLLISWKNYKKPRRLITISIVSFYWEINYLLHKQLERGRSKEESIKKHLTSLTKAIDANDYKTHSEVKKHTVYYGNEKKVDKHIPILKSCGIASCIEPIDIYLSLEEFFSLEKTSSERIYSKGITNKEKIENHGFDTKTSFRGKNK